MSYTKPCNKCGERISLRQMPQGQWVAFDVSTEESHVCGVKNDPDISVKLSSKKKKEFEEDETIDLGYEDDFLETKKDIEESKTYSNSSGVNYCIDKAIINKKRILIDYYSDLIIYFYNITCFTIFEIFCKSVYHIILFHLLISLFVCNKL